MKTVVRVPRDAQPGDLIEVDVDTSTQQRGSQDLAASEVTHILRRERVEESASIGGGSRRSRSSQQD